MDSLAGNTVTISLTNAPVTLTTPPNSGAAWSGPYQSQSALIRFTGTLTAAVQVTMPRAGFWIVENLCTVGAYYVQLTGGSGNVIGAPPGKKCHVYFDGTNMDYVNMPDVGTAYDLHGATALPAWMNACTVKPYLVKDGSLHNYSDYPALAAMLGSTFGGNGITTFGVPDERARARIGFDTGATGRLTTAGNGTVNGTTMASAGGDQLMQTHLHTASVTDPGHTHTAPINTTQSANAAYSYNAGLGAVSNGSTGTAVTGISVAVANAGSGASQNVPPSIISFLPLIKTAILIGFLIGGSNMLPSHAAASQVNGAIAASELTRQLSPCYANAVKAANFANIFFG